MQEQVSSSPTLSSSSRLPADFQAASKQGHKHVLVQIKVSKLGNTEITVLKH